MYHLFFVSVIIIVTWGVGRGGGGEEGGEGEGVGEVSFAFLSRLKSYLPKLTATH